MNNHQKNESSKETPRKERKKEIKTIAVLCSGGDAPAMNSAIRAVVRSAIGLGLKVYGVKRGYSGLLTGDIHLMDASSVGNILQRGGTILQTSRCEEFLKEETRKEAANILKRKGIDGLIVIGGNGSLKGAMKLHEEHNLPLVGIPGSIDNDIQGTDYSIGFDTAVQTAVEAVDKIRDTANSHERNFIVEVMGRKSEAIAFHVGVCTGAENIIFPSRKIDYKEIYQDIQRGIERGKNSSLIIVAEGDKPGLGYQVQKKLKELYSVEAHVCILGHIQRGGRPTANDRFMASQMGILAVEAIKRNDGPAVIVHKKGVTKAMSFEECSNNTRTEIPSMEIIKTLSI